MCYFCFIKCIKYESSASSEIVSESTETQKEEPKEPEAQKEPSKESEKSNRKKAYVIFFRVDESFLGTICDENGDILTGTALSDFDG